MENNPVRPARLILALQRMSAEEIGEYTRVTRLRHVIGSMVEEYPDLQKIEDKLSKGHKSKIRVCKFVGEYIQK